MCPVRPPFVSLSDWKYTVTMTEVIVNDVAACRQKRGITQEQLAQAVGVTRQTIIAIEKGNYTPSLLLAFKICHFFKNKVEDIFSLSS